MNPFINQSYTQQGIVALSRIGVEAVTASTPMSALRSLFLNLSVRLAPFRDFTDVKIQLLHASFFSHEAAARLFGKNVIDNYNHLIRTVDSLHLITTPDEPLCCEKWSECIALFARLRSDFYHVLTVSIADSLVRSSPITTEVQGLLAEGEEYDTLVEEYMFLTTKAVLKQLYV